jgi:hypothetical protein
VGAVTDNATIAVTRARGGWRDLLRKYLIMIDGAVAGKIRRGQTLELPVTPGRHEIFLKVDWCRSPSVELDASPGEVIDLRCAPGGSAMEGLGAVLGDATASYISLTRVEDRTG